MKIDFVKDGHLFIQELSNDLLYGVYRIEDDSLIKEGGFLTKGEGPFEVVHPDLWGNEDDSFVHVSNYAGIIKEIYSIKMADIYHKEKMEYYSISGFSRMSVLSFYCYNE